MGRKPVLVLPSILLILCLLAGCGGGQQNISNPAPPAPVNPTLAAIVVSPSSAQASAGSSEQFTATGKYSDGSTKNLTSSVNWSSSPSSVASVTAAGVVSAREPGSSTIVATEGSVHGTATLTVTSALLTSISVTPAGPTLAAGTTMQLQATGIFADGSTQNLTNAVAWVTSTPQIASVSAGGLLHGLRAGVATVVASQGLISTAVNITVNSPVLVSLAVSPDSASIAVHTTQQFSAVGTFTDGSTQDLTSIVTWSSSASTIATVRVGLASGVAAGAVMITAASGSINSSASLTITSAAAVSIAVSPVNPSLVVGLSQQFSAMATFNDGSTQDISGVAAWASSTPSVAGTNNAGLASGISPGTTVISASFEQVTGSSNLSVQAPSLIALSAYPANASIASTTSEPFFVTGYYNDGSTQTLASATWSSSNPAVAAMNGNLAVSAQPGTTTITAVVGPLTASTTLTVTSATLQSIGVIPATATIASGTTQAFFATGTFSDGTSQSLTDEATWRSSNAAVAAMSENKATGLSGGGSTIGATFDGVTGSSALTVTQATLTALAITPLSPVLVVGELQQLTASGTFSDGSRQNLTALVVWSSSSPGVAAISSTGLAGGQAGGTTTISATLGSVTVSTNVTVSAATLVSLSVAPQTLFLPPGTSQQFSATGTYSDGTVQKVTTMAHWTSSDAGVATVGNIETSGQVTAVSFGWTRISALLDSVIASAVVNVNNATLVSLSITPADPTLALVSSQQLTATGTFSDGSTQDLSAWVSWNSSNSQVCVVSSSGYASSSGTGTATISASFGSISATTALTVY